MPGWFEALINAVKIEVCYKVIMFISDTWTVSWQTFDIFCSFLQGIRYQVLGFVVCEIHI